MTKDGYLVMSHDPCLKGATNVELYHEEWEMRKGSWEFIEHYNLTYTDDYLIHDFTLKELR